MDQQTIQQIITGCIALVAALGGAGVTALINHKNAEKQIAASKAQHEQQWLETRAVERERWARDRKIESYSAFVRAASPFHLKNIGEITKVFSPSKRELGETDLHTALTDVVIFGSNEVIIAASDYRRLAYDLSEGLSGLEKKAIDEAVERARRGESVSDGHEDEAGKLAQKSLRTEVRELTEGKIEALVEKFSTLVNLMRTDCGIEEIDGVFSVTLDLPD